jgi:hypothetical protein
MRTRSYGPLALLIVVLSAACSPPPGPITVDENVLSVQNQTPREWRNVVVTVNDHFRGGAARLPPGGRMTASLGQFQTAFGQHYDIARQSLFKVEVTAADADGSAVNLRFEPGRR